MPKKQAEIIKFPKVDKEITTQGACHAEQNNTKRKKREKIRVYRDLAYVRRANDPNKYLSFKARVLLSVLTDEIAKNEERVEFFDHNFFSFFTQCRSSTQNRNILSQLANVIEYKYYNCVTFQGQRRLYGYIIKFIEPQTK